MNEFTLRLTPQWSLFGKTPGCSNLVFRSQCQRDQLLLRRSISTYGWRWRIGWGGPLRFFELARCGSSRWWGFGS